MTEQKLQTIKHAENIDPTLAYNYCMLFLTMMSIGALVIMTFGVWRIAFEAEKFATCAQQK